MFKVCFVQRAKSMFPAAVVTQRDVRNRFNDEPLALMDKTLNVTVDCFGLDNEIALLVVQAAFDQSPEFDEQFHRARHIESGWFGDHTVRTMSVLWAGVRHESLLIVPGRGTVPRRPVASPSMSQVSRGFWMNCSDVIQRRSDAAGIFGRGRT